jgi:iron complex transport system ATP-binding protein
LVLIINADISTVLHAKLQGVFIQGQKVLLPLEVSLADRSSSSPGSWTALVGPNGAGKSTLLRALAGLQEVQGTLELQPRRYALSKINGHLRGLEVLIPLAQLSSKDRAQQIAWLGPQEPGADDLCVMDVVMLGRLPHQDWLAAPSAADHAAVQRAMQQTQCEAWSQRRLGTLSSGQRQRVLIARALAVEAAILLMDEPLAHLDAPHQADWLETVRTLVAQGTTIVSALHELNMALQADSLLIMANGQVLHHGAPQDSATHAALQTAFDHRLRLLAVDGQWVALV